MPDVEEECLVEQPVSGISGLSGNIELGGEDAPTRALHLEMKMTRSAGVKRGSPGSQVVDVLDDLAQVLELPHALLRDRAQIADLGVLQT